ncbi:MAG TPA: thiolase family protein [Thermoanaerobaculia bacterium]|nr:thiolase family protein [Thermoanaerobaculia bacterium]
MEIRDLVLVGGARTPMGDFNGSLAEVTAIDLGVHAAKAAMERAGVAPEEIDHTIVGNVLQTSADAIYGGRHVALKAGVPKERPALTVNRLCGSGIEAIVQGGHRVLLGEAGTVLVGGMENMSQAPHVVWGARRGFRLGSAQLEDSLLASLMDPYCGCYMAQTSNNLANDFGISRQEQDAFAVESQRRAAAAWDAGRMADEVAPIEVGRGKRAKTVERDEHIRADTTVETLARLPPAFDEKGYVTAGNASGIVDGAAMLVLTSEAKAAEKGWKPMGRLLGWHVVGVEPSRMGIGPSPAIRGLLDELGMKLADVDLVEINEAFAGQILAVMRDLDLDHAKLNVNGGAIALGHPLGATGARITLTLLHELGRRGGGVGIASACIGGGQGIALAVESAG